MGGEPSGPQGTAAAQRPGERGRARLWTSFSRAAADFLPAKNPRAIAGKIVASSQWDRSCPARRADWVSVAFLSERPCSRNAPRPVSPSF